MGRVRLLHVPPVTAFASVTDEPTQTVSGPVNSGIPQSTRTLKLSNSEKPISKGKRELYSKNPKFVRAGEPPV
jgi:hypothetical protein